jgi:cell shape-determining protein MreC
MYAVTPNDNFCDRWVGVYSVQPNVTMYAVTPFDEPDKIEWIPYTPVKPNPEEEIKKLKERIQKLEEILKLRKQLKEKEEEFKKDKLGYSITTNGST